MLAITVINLYAIRILLRTLGQEDFGTFNAVAGVILTSAFITTTLAISIQRFYSYALGEGEREQLSDIFSASINVIIILSIVLFILFETIGVWFISSKLAIPHERITAANWVFQFSIGALWLSLVQQPFTAAIFAHEDMGLFALISLTECILRLGLVIAIGYINYDCLIIYGAGLLGIAIVIFTLYASTAHYRYSECRYHHIAQKGIYKSLLSFSGWTMYSALAGVGLTQGITIILYMFFGPLSTAAYNISQQVLHAFQTLSNSVVVAFRPAMVKSYAEKDNTSLYKMFTANNKFILYLLLIVAIPLTLELRLIFGWWLDSVTEESIVFTRLIIVYMICFSMHNPVTTIVQSTGKVQAYSLVVDTILLLCVPASWLAFQMGAPSYACLILMIVMCLMAHFVRLIILHHLYPAFRYSTYLSGIVLPGVLVTIIVSIVTYIAHFMVTPGFQRFAIVFTTAIISMVLAVYLIGLTKEERQQTLNLIKTIITKK